MDIFPFWQAMDLTSQINTATCRETLPNPLNHLKNELVVKSAKPSAVGFHTCNSSHNQYHILLVLYQK